MDFANAFKLDATTGRLFWKTPPQNHAEKAGQEAGYLCPAKGKNKPYWHIRFAGRTYKRSRVVFYITHGRWPAPCVDHIDGNSLNDCPSNLREASYTQNAQNQAPRRNKASGLPQGVSPYQGKYRAQIMVNGKRKVLGQFNDPQEAALAYQIARREMFNEYA